MFSWFALSQRNLQRSDPLNRPRKNLSIEGHGDQAPGDDAEEAVTGSQLGTVSEDVKEEENEDPDEHAGCLCRFKGGKRFFWFGGREKLLVKIAGGFWSVVVWILTVFVIHVGNTRDRPGQLWLHVLPTEERTVQVMNEVFFRGQITFLPKAHVYNENDSGSFVEFSLLIIKGMVSHVVGWFDSLGLYFTYSTYRLFCLQKVHTYGLLHGRTSSNLPEKQMNHILLVMSKKQLVKCCDEKTLSVWFLINFIGSF